MVERGGLESHPLFFAYDELRIEHRAGIDRIIVYNHAIMLLKSADEIYRPIWRVFFQIDRMGETQT